MYPTVNRNIGEEYRLPQITIGAKAKWQPYLGDLCIIIWVRYHTHTHTHKHKTHTRTCALNTKTNKIKKVKGVKVKKKRKTTKSQMNYGVKILYNF